ncbi:hypothetical protein [Humibacter ginsenosidimutans]|uniref:Uncharacterized protein n=1 Tax=Humibacter ginsenosidimutans TaxID=2599293 RepID=A0A5B8MA53_9MICO|nr:hypothetical protein [Humibacter ginsenosidimutans]QDZ16525.1 hypothetical protein FPZ11_18815 [Humibacter ginsenosidimutans]
MYIATRNNHTSMELTDAFRPYKDQLRRSLGLLDGEKNFSYELTKLADGVSWSDARKTDYGQEYLQSAGTAERMTIEIRRLAADGNFHQYAVGRAEAADEELTELVRYGKYKLHVAPSEVFDADAAAEVYYHYFQTNTVPEGMHLRELDFS